MGWFEFLSRPMHQAVGDDKKDHIPSPFGKGQVDWDGLPIDHKRRDSRLWTDWSRPRGRCQNCERSREAGVIGKFPSGRGGT